MSKYKRTLNIKWVATTKKGIEELAKNTDFTLTTSDFRILSRLWNVSVRRVRTWSRRRSEES